jgi:hypothetical protein
VRLPHLILRGHPQSSRRWRTSPSQDHQKRLKLCRRASSSRTPIAAKGGAAEGSAEAEGGASAGEGGAAVGNGDGGGGATTPPPPTSVPQSCVHRDLVPCQDQVQCRNPGPEGALARGCLVALNIKHPCNPIPVCCCNSISILLPGGAHNFVLKVYTRSQYTRYNPSENGKVYTRYIPYI